VQQRLFSVGRDRRCFEYDVRDARYHAAMPVLREFIIEMEAKPTCCIWYPQIDTREDILLTTNDEYKIKLWNPTTMTARRTCLGPTYGGEITKLKQVDVINGEKFLCYATEEKVIGLIKLPLDGNPHNTMGLISHPKELTDICTTVDGKWVFTCGGEDLAVNMWNVDVAPINQAIAMGGQGIDPFVNLIEGGLEGQTYQDMKDFFYYAMIKAQVEDTTKTRKLNQHVPVEQLPNLMRAMGYYPTEHEIKCMIDEVRQCAMSNEGRTTTHVNLDTFVKLFVNHRPVYGIGKNNIEEAFRILTDSKMAEGNIMTREDLITCLTSEGEDGGMKI
jgi:WD40 repeat protein